MQRRFASRAFLLALFTGATASANPGLSGYSGKPDPFSGQSATCNPCHSGGTAPAVMLSGPTTLKSGEVGEYTFTVTHNNTRSAANITVPGFHSNPDGGTLEARTGTKVEFNEIWPTNYTQNGSATFRFGLKAPATGGKTRIWAVGMAENGGGRTGDGVQATTLDVTIDGPAGPGPGPSDGGPTTAPDGAVIDTGDGGGSGTGSGNGTGDGDGTGSGADDGTGTDSRTRRSSGSSDEGGCSTSPVGSSAGVAAGWLAATAAIVVAARRRRARAQR